MLAYLLRRLAFLAVSLVVAMVAIFVLLRLLPGDPANALLSVNATPEQIAEDAASVWLYLYPQIVVARADVSGYPVNGLNSQFFAYDIVKS